MIPKSFPNQQQQQPSNQTADGSLRPLVPVVRMSLSAACEGIFQLNDLGIMRSSLRTDNEVNEEITILRPHELIRRSSLQHQTPRTANKKVSSSKENQSVRMQEKGSPAKSGKPTTSGETDDINFVSSVHSGSRHKPWPSRKVNEVEEVVKNMSRVPSYLQRMGKGDSVQEKALNIGVLDWQSLESWTHLQKQDANRKGGDSSSSSNLSSSHSSRNNGGPLAQRKQVPANDAYRSSSAGDRRINTSGDSRTSHVNSSAPHKHEKIKSRDTESFDIYHKKSQSANIICSPYASLDNDTARYAHKKNNQLQGSSESEKVYEEQTDPGHLEASIEKRNFSFDSDTVNSGIVSGVTKDGHSGIVSPDNMQFSSPSLSMRYSYPIPAVSSCSLPEIEMSVANIKGKHATRNKHTDKRSELVQGEMKIATASRRDLSPHRLLTAGLSRLRGSSVKDNRRSYSGPLPSASHSYNSDVSSILQSELEPFAVNITCSSREFEAKAATGPPRRDLSPHRLLTAGLNRLRSNSVRESSPRRQTVCSTEDNVAATGKGRRSPLRRMFDPLLKSKNRMPFSGPIVSLASHQSNELSNSERLPIREELQSAKGINPSTSQVSEPRCSVQDEISVMSTRQAVLKLAWKNGLPLFMFSCDNNDILAATIGKRNASEKKDFECLYTIFTAHEVKKKGGAWMGQGNKSKKNGLVYNVVGHIRISFPKPDSYGSMGDSEMRECILFGSEMIPTSEKPVSSELAAVLIQSSSTESPKCSFSDVSSCCQAESLQSEQSAENSAMSKIVAVLPKGVHGLSSECEPSPLIERWKSGGSCDCGGWDEGCILTVLTACLGTTSAQNCITDGTHQTKLFTQASEARANKHAFSMDTFEEGVYTVDFRASVASVQAFAICISILHCRKSTNLSGLKHSVEAQNLQEDSFPEYTDMVPTKTEEEDPVDYVPVPPPSSPVGRA